MPVLSHFHQLFNAEQCQAYIHTLRWKDRPLQCPRCQSHDIDPWGTYHYRPGCKRYWCHGCKRTFNDLTDTLLHQSKRSLPYWILATFLLCLAVFVSAHCQGSWASISGPAIAGAGGCAMPPCPMRCTANWRARWKRMTSITPPATRGKRKQGGKKSLGRRARGRRKKREPGRGHYDKDRPAIIAWVSRQGAVVIQATRDFTVKTVQKAADLAVQAGSRLYTDSASSYRALKGYVHEFVNHTQKEYARGDVHENRAECLFSLLKPYLRVFRGVSKFNLPGYVGFFQFLRNFRQQNAFEQAELILQAALDPTIASRAKKENLSCVLITLIFYKLR